MLYDIKNRFLIIGLTGPLGTGCTTTAKFLSGTEINGFKFDSLIEELSNKIDEINVCIQDEYNKIADIKKSIEIRRSKDFGPYTDVFINPNNDIRLRDFERKLPAINQKLKIYLRQREIYKVLNSFKYDPVLKYENVNDQDIFLFGFKPFIYISFTTIIIKIAIEAINQKDGSIYFDSYCSKKRKKIAGSSNKLVFDKLIDRLKDRLTIEQEDWLEFKKGNSYVKDRDYNTFKNIIDTTKRLGSTKTGITNINKIKDTNKKLVQLYYLYHREN